MKLSVVRLVALAAPLAALVGCSAAAPTDGDPSASSSSAMSIVPILIPSPMSLCSGITADQSKTWSSTPNPGVFAATSDPTRSCDYSVFEVTGTMGHNLRLSLTDLIPNSSYGSYPLQYPYTAVTEAACSQSYVDYEAFGYVPPKWIFNGTNVVEVPGYWEAIGTEHFVTGAWGYGSGESGLHCTFPIESAGVPAPTTLVSGTQTHSIVRVAVKSVLATPSGPARGGLYVFKEIWN